MDLAPLSKSAYIALGSNMPWQGVSGPALLMQAVTVMGDAGLAVRARSGVWQTEAWPAGSGQPDYFNAVVEIDPGDRAPERLYDVLRQIEARFGRERRTRWEARTLDLDIVAMGDLAGTFGEINLPHERMERRVFVLAPLVEIAPAWRHPISQASAKSLLEGLPPTGYRRVAELA
jgi:2-amino-4-hydroxy-6-hydroxymethyldihydropteridine diphosphokinase